MRVQIEVTQKGELTEGHSDLIRQAVILTQTIIRDERGYPTTVELDTPFGKVSIDKSE